MSSITLTTEQYNRLPYKGSEITRGKSYGEIIGLLEQHGITAYQFTKNLEGVDVLAFPLKIKHRDREVSFMVKLTVPRLQYPVKRGRGYNAVTTMTYLEKESWRVFWWYLKSKLEAIEFGISDEVREFLPDIYHKLPSGEEVSLSDLIKDNAARLDKLALPDKSASEPRSVEAEFEVKDSG
jgi:hypothetical protein